MAVKAQKHISFSFLTAPLDNSPGLAIHKGFPVHSTRTITEDNEILVYQNSSATIGKTGIIIMSTNQLYLMDPHNETPSIDPSPHTQ